MITRLYQITRYLYNQIIINKANAWPEKSMLIDLAGEI